jgi:hypothetical protein
MMQGQQGPLIIFEKQLTKGNKPNLLLFKPATDPRFKARDTSPSRRTTNDQHTECAHTWQCRTVFSF